MRLQNLIRCAGLSLFLMLQPVMPLPAQTRPAEPVVSANDLPRIPATEAKEALKTFQLRPGFKLELAAAEPDVIDPIAMCFDERGRMFVIEMRDYSERRAEKLSRIRMLEDLDNDGRYEKSTVFLDKLAWATAVICVNGGVLVGATPDILFAKDTNGDGVADKKTVLFTGFGSTQEKLNVQGLFNNFNWGLDNRIHGCSGLNGGLVEQKLHPDKPPIDVRAKGFVINPRDWSMTTENGGGQYGLSFDPWGRMYTCSNSSHIETFMYDARYAARNADFAMPNPRVMIAADGPAAEVYRISPEEPWRVIRTRWRISGLVKGTVEGGGRSAGYFTGATGITIYRGNAYGPDYVGDAFVGDAGGNLVHHKRIRPGQEDPLELVAERPADEQKIEFLASTDNWFRPVDFANAPDGTLYIADMYRETIEHPWSIPPSIKQFLDLNSGNDRGRVYRIVPENFERPPHPRLDRATTAELVETLADDNGWHRETAARLLYERQDRAAAPHLVRMAAENTDPPARVHALYALDGLSALEESHVIGRADDMDSMVRKHALVLSERFLPAGKPSDALWNSLPGFVASDRSSDVSYQLALTLSLMDHPDRGALLFSIASQHMNSRWVRSAVLNGLPLDVGLVLETLGHGAATPADREFVSQVAEIVAARRSFDQIDRVLGAMHGAEDDLARLAIARGLAKGAAHSGALASLRPRMVEVFKAAAVMAADDAAAPADRAAAVALLAYAEEKDAMPGILGALDEQKSQQLQLAAISALDQLDSSDTVTALVRRWPQLRPRVRSEALGMLLKRPERTTALLNAIKAEQIARTDLSASQVSFLRTHANARVKDLAATLLASPDAARDAVVENFRPALSMAGDTQRGHTVYQKLCISCHKLGDEGFLLGPDLSTVRNAGREKLLLSILDPSREVLPNFVSYRIDTTDGDSVLGLLVSDTPAGLTLRQAYGKETTIQRDKIKKMSSDGRSMMPDGLEVGMTPQDMADLLTFIEG